MPPGRQNPAHLFRSLPESVRLREVPWQLFATLTFKDSRNEQIRHFMVRAWLRQLAKGRAYYPDLLFAYRFEKGRSGEHPHFHVLVAGLHNFTSDICNLADSLWKTRGGGFTRIERYNSSRDGVGYVLKQPQGYALSVALSADEIDIPTLSDSVIAFFRRPNP